MQVRSLFAVPPCFAMSYAVRQTLSTASLTASIAPMLAEAYVAVPSISEFERYLIGTIPEVLIVMARNTQQVATRAHRLDQVPVFT